MLRIFGHFLPIPPLLLAVAEAMALSGTLYIFSRAPDFSKIGSDSTLVQFAVASALLAIISMLAVGLYRADSFLDRRIAFSRVLIALLLAAPFTLLIGFFLQIRSGTPESLGSYWFVKVPIAWLLCFCVLRTTFWHFSNLQVFKRRILVLGSGARALEIKKLGERGIGAGFTPVAFVNACRDPRLVNALDYGSDPDGHSLEKIAHDLGAQGIVIATDDRRGLPVDQLLRCRLCGIDVVDYLTFFERETGRANLDALQPSWFILSEGFRMGWFSEFVKRSFDLFVSITMLAATLPVLLITALAIKLESSGPILYRQERVGLRGRRFVLLKFRSMSLDAEENGGPMWALRDDPRATRIGALIRKVRIDELPQLLNVIRGDMSFVGPRPERPYFVEQLTKEIPFYAERHAVRPGITGWAQINYPYGASIEDARQKLSYDLYYLKNRSLFLDLVILVQTARVILWPQGAR